MCFREMAINLILSVCNQISKSAVKVSVMLQHHVQRNLQQNLSMQFSVFSLLEVIRFANAGTLLVVDVCTEGKHISVQFSELYSLTYKLDFQNRSFSKDQKLLNIPLYISL